MKVAIALLLCIAVVAAQDCLPNQAWSASSNSCVNQQGWCKPKSGFMLTDCTLCTPCPATGACPDNQVCFQQLYCSADMSMQCGVGKVTPTVLPKTSNLTNQTTQNCLPNQQWDATLNQCSNLEGWCKPIGKWVYDTCATCVKCPATGPCPGNGACVKTMNCENFNTLCDGTADPKPICLPNQVYDPTTSACKNMVGYCKPANSWLVATCDQCVKCPTTGACPGNAECVQNINCQDYNTMCDGSSTPTPKCLPNQQYDPKTKACVNEVGWCKPADSWLVNSCDTCVPCPKTGACPNNEQCVKSINCGDYTTACGGSVTPTPTCYKNQYYDAKTKACVNEVGYCQPSNGGWLYDACSSCVACPTTGPCPNNSACISKINCNDWDTYCGATSFLQY